MGPVTVYYYRLLGGSWVVISRVRSPLIWVISIVALLITLLITTHEPPSGWLLLAPKSLRESDKGFRAYGI